MKLAAFHKKNHDIVEMEKKFSSDKCTKVYIRKDYEDFEYPKYIVEDPKVEWGGYAPNNGVYAPLPPEIERCVADTSIYNCMERFYDRGGETLSLYKKMKRSIHFRFQTTEDLSFLGWDKQTKKDSEHMLCYMNHDKEITSVKDSLDNLRGLMVKANRRCYFGFKFPIRVTTSQALEDWGSLPKMRGLCNIDMLTLMPDESFIFLSPYRQQLTYRITNQYWTHDSFIAALPQILLQAVFLQSYDVKILLKLENDFLVEPEWRQYQEMFNFYIANYIYHRTRYTYCPFIFCKYSYDNLYRDEKINLFRFIKEQSEELFWYMYGVEDVRPENGILKPQFYTTKEKILGGQTNGYFHRKGNKGKNQPEQLSYAEIVQPEYVYLE